MVPSPPSPALSAELVLRASQERSLRSSLRRTELGFGAAGAALHELARAGRISVSPAAVLVRSARRHPDPVADSVLERLLFAPRARAPRTWIERLGADVLDRTRTALVAQGLLVPVERRLMGIFPRREYAPRPGLVMGCEEEVVACLLEVVRHPGRPPRTACPITDAVASATTAASYVLAFSG